MLSNIILCIFSQNQQNIKNTKLMNCTDRVNNDFNNMSSTSSVSDFIFEPVVNLFKSPGNEKNVFNVDYKIAIRNIEVLRYIRH